MNHDPLKRKVKRRSEKIGLSPGSLVLVGEQRTCETKLRWIRYDEKTLEEREIKSIDEALTFKDNSGVNWLDIEGIHDTNVVAKTGSYLGIHPLILEDILNASIRPKQEDHKDYIVVILKMLCPNKNKVSGNVNFESEQVTFILGKNWLVTFQEAKAGDVFDFVRTRIRSAKGKIRGAGPDYLAYALIDAIVDGYFSVLEDLGESIEEMEQKVTERDSALSINNIHDLRRFALSFRRAAWPVRDILSALERDQSNLISAQTHVYLRDVYDHSIEIIDMIESYREMVAGLIELYLSSMSHRMNSIMMVLTVVTTIFMPLTFIAGIYGMNFEHMPELKWEYGYPLIMVVMLAIAVTMLVYFRKRKWV